MLITYLARGLRCWATLAQCLRPALVCLYASRYTLVGTPLPVCSLPLHPGICLPMYGTCPFGTFEQKRTHYGCPDEGRRREGSGPPM